MTVLNLMHVLNFPEYRHVCIRRENNGLYDFIGGGSPAYVIRRFGHLDVVRADYVENTFIIFVTY